MENISEKQRNALEKLKPKVTKSGKTRSEIGRSSKKKKGRLENVGL